MSAIGDVTWTEFVIEELKICLFHINSMFDGVNLFQTNGKATGAPVQWRLLWKSLQWSSTVTSFVSLIGKLA